MQNLKTKTLNGLKWGLSSRMARLAIELITQLFLLRWIAPAYFGMLAMATVVAGFFNLILHIGTDISIISQKDTSADDWATLYWFNWIYGLVLGGLYFCFTYLGNQLLPTSINTIFLVGFALQIFLNGPSAIVFAQWQKDLRFSSYYAGQFFPLLLANAFALFFAFQDMPFVALFCRIVIPAFVLFLIGSYFFHQYPRIINWSILKKHLRFSIPLLGTRILNFASRNIDDLLIGYTLGNYSLGLYNRAYRLLKLPSSNLTAVFSQVLLPVIAKKSNSSKFSGNLYLLLTQGIAILLFPIMVWLALTAPHLIPFAFGEAWTNMIPLAQIFAILSIIQAIGGLQGVFLQGNNATKLELKLNLINQPLIITSIILGYFSIGNIYGIALFYSMGSCLALFISWYYLRGLFNCSLKTILYNFTLPVTAVLAALFAYFLILKLFVSYDFLFKTPFASLVYFMVYITLIYLNSPAVLKENLRTLIATFSNSRLNKKTSD